MELWWRLEHCWCRNYQNTDIQFGISLSLAAEGLWILCNNGWYYNLNVASISCVYWISNGFERIARCMSSFMPVYMDSSSRLPIPEYVRSEQSISWRIRFNGELQCNDLQIVVRIYEMWSILEYCSWTKAARRAVLYYIRSEHMFKVNWKLIGDVNGSGTVGFRVLVCSALCELSTWGRW